MPSPTRLIVRGAPLSPTFKGTLNEFYKAMLDRLEVISPFGQLQFQVGGVQPSSNVGPWLKDGSEWWVWDEATKTYVPITINPGSLSEFLSIEAFNTAIAAYSTTTQMNDAIAAAVGGISAAAGRNLFKAKPSANQDVVHGGAGTITTDIALGTAIFDTESNFAGSQFTAPADGYYEFKAAVQVSVPSGSATSVITNASFSVNGGSFNPMSNQDDIFTSQRIHTGSTAYQLTAGDTVKLVLNSTVDDAATVRIEEAYTFFTGNRLR